MRAYALDPDTAGMLEPVRARSTALPSIAVLPMANLGKNREDNYFADGIVDDIIVSLANLRELLVITRTSALAIGRRQADPREVGRSLGVRYVLTGSVRRSAGRVRVSVRLHDVQTGASLWGDTTEVAPGELFELQDRIVHRIVAGIAPHVRAAELRNALRKRPDSFTAYEHTLRALEAIYSLERPEFFQARNHLDRAMDEDPKFAMPVAWAARWYSLLIGQGWSDDRQGDARRAAELATRAIELDRQNAIALATYGHVRSFLFHDCDSALIYFDRALTACPNSALAWILLSATQSYIGRADQGVRSAEHAISLSPFDQSLFYYYLFLGIGHLVRGAPEDAVKWCRMSLSENPRYTATLRILTGSLSALGRLDEARETAARLLALEPDFSLGAYRRIQPFREPEFQARYIEHLQRAGLPA
jgi:adenylate cyclase